MDIDENNSKSTISSDDEDEVSEEKLKKIGELEERVRIDPNDYNAHVDLIKTLREVTDFDKLRFARNYMAKHFPLSSDLWMEWLSDEMKIATSIEEKQNVERLFEKAVIDYLSVDVWLEYVQFSIGMHAENDTDGAEIVRKIFERSLSAAGLHVPKGSLLWEAFIEFEVLILSLIQEKASAKDEVEKQLKRIANLFRRQLSCPLFEMDETFERFNMWLVDNTGSLDSNQVIDRTFVETTYKNAKNKLSKIEKFEIDLLGDVNNYKDYLEHEKSKEGTPGRVLCLYERLLCDLCLNDALWLEYIDYVATVLQDDKLAIEATKRAIRNCPWSGQLAQQLLRLLEKNNESHQTIVEAVESTLTPHLKQPLALRDIWIAYLEYMRRRFDAPDISKEEEKKRLDEMRAAFTKAVEYLNAVEGGDPECVVAQFYARVEGKCGKDLEKARLIWSEILAEPEHRTAVMWLEYINLEMAYGDSKHLRKLLPRALQQTTDWPESIYSVWLNYERDEGTLESYLACVSKCTARIEQVKKQRDVLESRNQSSMETHASRDDNRRSRRAGLGYQKPDKREEVKREKVNPRKRQCESNQKSEGSPEKKKKVLEGTDDIVTSLLNEDKKGHGVTVKHDSSKDIRTVFVSNLDYTTEDEILKEIFSADGEITDIRLVRDFKGRSKGYCYVEFAKIEMAQKALKRDRQLIGERPMYVSRCDPDRETRSSGFRFATKIEKNKVFVRGLPFTTTEEDLRKLFGQYGTLKDVRLVTFRNGHSKGLAYVDYEDDISASQAILKTDGMTLEDKQISVAISNPPGRSDPTTTATASISSLGGGKKEAGPRGRGRTQISFLPRSLQLNSTSTTKSLEKLSLMSPQPPSASL